MTGRTPSIRPADRMTTLSDAEQRRSVQRLFLDTALDAVIVMDAAGRVSDWNDHAAAMFGWSAEDAVGRSLAELIIPERYRAAHAAGLDKFLRSGEGPLLGRRIEISGLRKSGEEFPVELTISPIRQPEDWVFIGSLRDLSERRRAEQYRAQQALKMEVLYRAVSFAGETESFEDALRLCLESVQRLTGWPVGHVYLPTDMAPVVLMPSGIWHLTHPDRYAGLREITARTYLEPGQGLPGRIWITGEPTWIADIETDPNVPRARTPGIGVRAAFGLPIKVRGAIIAVLEFFSDVPEEPDAELMLTLRAIADQVGRVFERRQAEAALRQQTEALEQSNLQLQTELMERERAEEHQRLLLAELDHRVKNMLAVVTGIAAQTARSSRSVAAFNENFMARLNALARAHTLLTAGRWDSAPLGGLVKELLAPYAHDEGHLQVDGPPIALRPKAALAISMILHELITNAAKYGALSVPEGRILVAWSVASEPDRMVRLSWRETGLTGVVPPKRSGFGSKMIAASAKHELGGRVEVEYHPDGVRYAFEFPANQ